MRQDDTTYRVAQLLELRESSVPLIVSLPHVIGSDRVPVCGFYLRLEGKDFFKVGKGSTPSVEHAPIKWQGVSRIKMIQLVRNNG